ncbi:MAG TPA: cellulase family glycosylhydrolase [Anaerolineales bacterium]|nr:cellulase family glycosylhydrolase [Anaerolineales bacterium]
MKISNSKSIPAIYSVAMIMILSISSLATNTFNADATAVLSNLFSENWDTGTIDPTKWTLWGNPQPSLYSGQGVDGSYAVDNNGDGSYPSGLFVSTSFNLAQVRVEFWLRGNGPLGGLWSGNDVGFTLCTPAVNHETCGNWLVFIQASAETNFVTYHAYTQQGHEYFRETWGPLANEWHKYGFTIAPNGSVSFYRDELLQFTTISTIDFGTNNQAWLEIRGRSYNAEYYVDDIVVSTESSPGGFHISGRVVDGKGDAVAGVTISDMPGGTGRTMTTTDNYGYYTLAVPQDWSGILYPWKSGYSFSPPHRTYGNIQSNQTDQNYEIGFHLSGRNILDANGNNFIMRGINFPYTFFIDKAESSFANIKATGANTIRVVLSSGDFEEADGTKWTKTPPEAVDAAIELCWDNHLICVLSVHDTTGYQDDIDPDPENIKINLVSLTNAVDYWKEIKSVLNGKEKFVIINIGNEPYGNKYIDGNLDTIKGWFVDTKTAIVAMREAGFQHTLMVDAPNWGGDSSRLMLDKAADILENDPNRNTVFGIHMYGDFTSPDVIEPYINTFAHNNLPLVIGEFGHLHPSGDPDEEAIMSLAQSKGIGYLGWSWSGNTAKSGVEYLNMVTDFDSSQRTWWGKKIIGSEYGICRTSIEDSIYSGHRDPIVCSITLAISTPGAASVDFKVIFSEPVTGVGISDFRLTTSGVSGAHILEVAGSGNDYIVSINTGSGNGTIRLDVVDDDSIIEMDDAHTPLGGNGLGNGNFTFGETYGVLNVTSIGAYDGWILESEEDSNVGGTPNSKASIFNIGDDKKNNQDVGILHFDTTNLPDTAIVTSATLKIRKQGLTGTNPFTTHGDLLIDIKKPFFGTTASLEAGDFQDNFLCQLGFATFNPQPINISNWYSAIMDSSGDRIPPINLTGTTQFRLRFTLDDNNNRKADYISFSSGDAAMANRPQLIIQYYIP